MAKKTANPFGFNWLDFRLSITKPGPVTTSLKDTAVLRLWGQHAFIEYGRDRLEKVFDELEHRMLMVQGDLEEITESDKFLLNILFRMAAYDKPKVPTVRKKRDKVSSNVYQ